MPLNELAVPTLSLKVGGVTYKMSVLGLLRHAEAATKITESWDTPENAAKQLGHGLSDDAQRSLLEIAYRDKRRSMGPTLNEVFRWYETPYGALYKVWLALQDHHPELTVEDVDRMLVQSEVSADELAEMSAQVEGAPSGNSKAGAESPQETSQSTGLGVGSTLN